MTTVAYKNGVIAADTQLTAGTYKCGRAVKIFQAWGYLVGMSGDWAVCEDYKSWFKNTADRGIGKFDGKDGIQVMIINKSNGRIYEHRAGQSLIEYDSTVKDHAIGSGGPFAKVAMRMGADARKAVLIASEFDSATNAKISMIKTAKRK